MTFPQSISSDLRFCALRGSPAFTLMELLVVIAIISFFAAVTVPALQTVRSRADEMRCASNLRQLQAANISYANEHNGSFVPVSYNSTKWYSDLDFRSLLGLSITTDLTKFTPAIMCPGAVRDGLRPGYGYNWTSLPKSSTQQNDPTGTVTRSAKILQLKSPSKTLAFIDGLDWQVDCIDSNRYNGSTVSLGSDCAYRHRNGANVAFWDGHVEFLPRPKIELQTALWTFF